jgi:predicted kinase
MEAIILSGIQGAGKSTFCRERYWDSHIRISYAMLRTRHREKVLLEACLFAKQSFVVDSTNPTPADRARYLAPAKAAGFRVIGIEFHIGLDLALARNATRLGKRRIPEKAIRATLKKMVPLSSDEGFEEILIAEVTASGIELRRTGHAV